MVGSVRFIIQFTPSDLPIKVAAMVTVMFDLRTERCNFQSFPPPRPALPTPLPPPQKKTHNYKLADINAKSTADSWNICGDYNYYCFGPRLKFTARNMFIGRQHLKF